MLNSPIIELDRSLCSDLRSAEQREWLVTNGIGSFASGTVASVLTRRYHGLLVAALNPPLGRTLLATKFDETITYANKEYELSINRWEGGIENTAQPTLLDRFHLEGTTPVWSYTCADALVEKRVWMEQGVNTTYVRYDLKRASGPVSIALKALVNYRDYHSHTNAGDWHMGIDSVQHGLRINAFDGAVPFYLLSDRARATPMHEWYRGYYLSVEAYRGLHAVEDHLQAGFFEAELEAGESLTLVISTEESPELDGEAAYKRKTVYEKNSWPRLILKMHLQSFAISYWLPTSSL